MKIICTISLILFSIGAFAQTSIQLSGQVIRPPNDTIVVECFTDGKLVDKDMFIGNFYELRLGQAPHYIVKITSGSKIKYCTIFCAGMKIEKIGLDADFGTALDCIVRLDKPNAKYFTLVTYDRYGFTIDEKGIERTYAGY